MPSTQTSAHVPTVPLAGGSLRTSTRTEIGQARMTYKRTFRVNAHTDARTWSVDSTSVECLFSITWVGGFGFRGPGIHSNPPESDPRPNPSESGIHFCRVKMPVQTAKYRKNVPSGAARNPPEFDPRPNPSESGIANPAKQSDEACDAAASLCEHRHTTRLMMTWRTPVRFAVDDVESTGTLCD